MVRLFEVELRVKWFPDGIQFDESHPFTLDVGDVRDAAVHGGRWDGSFQRQNNRTVTILLTKVVVLNKIVWPYGGPSLACLPQVVQDRSWHRPGIRQPYGEGLKLFSYYFVLQLSVLSFTIYLVIYQGAKGFPLD